MRYDKAPIAGGSGSLAWLLANEHMRVNVGDKTFRLNPDEIAAIWAFVQVFPESEQ